MIVSIKFFKKFLMERPNFYKHFLAKYYIKKEIRQKQMEMCNQQDNLAIYRNETENNLTHDSQDSTFLYNNEEII